MCWHRPSFPDDLVHPIQQLGCLAAAADAAALAAAIGVRLQSLHEVNEQATVLGDRAVHVLRIRLGTQQVEIVQWQAQ